MKYKLNERNIDAVCMEANAFLVKRKTNPKELVLAKLSMEEVLLTYLEAFGSDAEFSVDYGGADCAGSVARSLCFNRSGVG